VIMQIIVIDMVFLLDSIITAIGMAQDSRLWWRRSVIACFVMYVSSGPVSKFVADHPTTKMLALAFLVLIRRGAGGRRIQIPHPGALYLLCTCLRRRRTVQCARQAQPPEGRQIAGFGRVS